MNRGNVYSAALMEHNAHPDYKYELTDFTHEHEGVNPSCGDEMTLRLRMSADGSVIEEVAFTGQGCAVSQASADIMAELDKPGLDPRGEVEKFEFDASIKTIEDLQVGMVVPGIVTNITKFGAFVDIGVHNDGLVHVSQMANRYVSDPSEVVKLHEHVMVRVTEVDLKRKRIALSMKQL